MLGYNASLKFLTIALAAICGIARAEEPFFYVGVQTHFYKKPETVVEQIHKIHGAHLNSVRASISWQYVETVKGEYKPTGAEASTIEAIDKAIAAGLHPLLILDFGNPLYEKDGLVTNEQSRKAFAGYVEWLATRYKGKVSLYEVWNEWAMGMGSTYHPPKPGSIAQYAALIAVTSQAVKRVDPDAKVIAGSIGNYNTRWFKGLLDSGAAKYLDGFSVHPYNFSYLHKPGQNTPEAAWQWIDELHKMELEETKRDMPFYVTEISWPSNVTNSDYPGYSDEDVAQNLARFMVEGRSRSYVKGIWWYDLVDDDLGSNNKESHFGLLQSNFQEKTSFQVLAKLAPSLASSVKVDIKKNNRNAVAVAVASLSSENGTKKSCVSWEDKSLLPVSGGIINVRGSNIVFGVVNRSGACIDQLDK